MWVDMRLFHPEIFPYDLGLTTRDLLVTPTYAYIQDSGSSLWYRQLDMQKEPEGLVDVNEGWLHSAGQQKRRGQDRTPSQHDLVGQHSLCILLETRYGRMNCCLGLPQVFQRSYGNQNVIKNSITQALISTITALGTDWEYVVWFAKLSRMNYWTLRRTEQVK